MTNHPNRNRSLAQWADVRNTSIEIARAIKNVASDHHETDTQEHADLMQQIWEDANHHQIHAILADAFSSTEEDELYWGSNTFTRGASDLDSLAKLFAT